MTIKPRTIRSINIIGINVLRDIMARSTAITHWGSMLTPVFRIGDGEADAFLLCLEPFA